MIFVFTIDIVKICYLSRERPPAESTGCLLSGCISGVYYSDMIDIIDRPLSTANTLAGFSKVGASDDLDKSTAIIV